MKKLLYILLFTPLSMLAQHSDVFSCVFTGVECETTEKTPPSVKIYPNPTVDFVTIEGAPHTEGVVLDAIGRVVRPFTIGAGGFLDVSDLPQGIFILLLRGGLSLKLVKT